MRRIWTLPFAIFAVLLLAFSLRFYRVWDNPPSLSWDEVSIGYNAYSILKTGKDEHGRFMPIDAFTAFGDYKPPASIYITVPFVALFGLNEVSVRLPSVLFGTMSVLAVYFLVLQLFGGLIDKKKATQHALLSSTLLAISPWHINLSRGGFEANIALFFIIFGTWLILSARTYPKRWIVAWIPIVISIYTFNSSRYFSVFFAIGLFIFLWRDIRKNIRLFAVGVFVAIILTLPLVPHLLSKEARLRFVEVNIFSDPRIVTISNTRIAREGEHKLYSKMLNNRRVGYVRSYLSHFMDNFQPEFLFFRGDGNPKFSTQDVGEMYLVEAPFLLFGIVLLSMDYPAVALFMLYWIVAAIIPAATARETPHALRILNSLPMWQIFCAYGVVGSVAYLSEFKRAKSIRTLFIVCLICLYIFNIAYYLHGYYRHYPVEFSGEWQYGYKQALSYIKEHENEYKKIYLSESIGRAYMYTLFYTKYDPESYRSNKKSYFDSAGFYHVDGFGKYIFTKDAPVALENDSLYIFPIKQEDGHVVVKKVIKLLDGTDVLSVYIKG